MSEDQSKKDAELKILKDFDNQTEPYGACRGITRLQRWERAEEHGLNPPKEVKEILLNHPDDPVYTKCWLDQQSPSVA